MSTDILNPIQITGVLTRFIRSEIVPKAILAGKVSSPNRIHFPSSSWFYHQGFAVGESRGHEEAPFSLCVKAHLGLHMRRWRCPSTGHLNAHSNSLLPLLPLPVFLFLSLCLSFFLGVFSSLLCRRFSAFGIDVFVAERIESLFHCCCAMNARCVRMLPTRRCADVGCDVQRQGN